MADRYSIIEGKLVLDASGELVMHDDYLSSEEAREVLTRAVKTAQDELSAERQLTLRQIESLRADHAAQLETHAETVQGLNGQLLEAGRANAALADQRDDYLLAAADRKVVLEQIRESIDAVLPQPPPTPLEDIVAEFIAKLPKPATRGR
jgi:hypothetical protein